MHDDLRLLFELRLIRWHLEFEVQEAGVIEHWRKYLATVDKDGEVRRYLADLASVARNQQFSLSYAGYPRRSVR